MQRKEWDNLNSAHNIYHVYEVKVTKTIAGANEGVGGWSHVIWDSHPLWDNIQLLTPFTVSHVTKINKHTVNARKLEARARRVCSIPSLFAICSYVE